MQSQITIPPDVLEGRSGGFAPFLELLTKETRFDLIMDQHPIKFVKGDAELMFKKNIRWYNHWGQNMFSLS